MELIFGRRCKISPLILTVIFMTFFYSVLSRHRIRHTRDRFKRQQGAHLYLPGSFVTDDDGGGGPDAGPWGEWTAPSPCSRTCGGGVASQERYCEGGYECRGSSKRYFTCNTQDCPDQMDFREQQCAEFNNILFEGVYYEWIPYTKAPNPCELNCMPRGERFYFRHATAVTDGTRCNDENFDVCVNGTCKPVGCDRMLGSYAREDQCRVCGGDGSSCHTYQNTVPMRDMQVGYNDILLIPAGATNIRVEETGPSNNYLAVRNTSGHYYLNGNWRIDFPRTVDFAGCRFKYERFPQGFAAPDIITCIGPTEEPLFIVLLYQDTGVPVSYTYSLPTNVPPPPNETYSWTYDEFTPCSATCGGGYQFRNVTCAGRNSLEPVDRSLCDSNNEPEEKRRCAEIACEAQWVPYPWKECSAPCGEGGVQTRDIFCQQIVSNGQPTLVADLECRQQKPPNEQQCNVGKICAKWHTGPWKPCDHLCGDGKQTRKIQCYIEKEQKKELLEDSECEAIGPRPEKEKKCNLRPCEGVDWITSDWSGCDRICGLKNETRVAHCATADGTVYSDDLCERDQKPELIRKCETTNTSCQYLWYASQWSECSVKCGAGVQTRTLFCGLATEDGVKEVENEKCDESKHFDTIKNCTGEMEECDGEWFSGPFSECSGPCGGSGQRERKVVCLKDLVVVEPTNCDSSKILFAQEECNTQPCSDDTILPTDVSHPVDESESTQEKEWDSEGTTAVGFKETEETEESKETKSVFDLTTEPSDTTEKSDKEDDEDEYEIVPDTDCDDGEWVDSEDLKQLDEPLGSTPVEGETETESPFSLDDIMLSDGTTTIEESSLDTGSGEGETSPAGSTDFTDSTKPSTEFEGSGSESTISEPIESESTYETGSSLSSSGSDGTESSTEGGASSVSTDEVSGSTSSSASSEGSEMTTESGQTEASSASSEGESESSVSESSDLTTESGTTDSSGSTDTSGASSSDSETGSTDTSATSESESSTSESSASSDLSSSGTTSESTDTDATESTVTGSSESTESGGTTESSDTSSSSESTDSTGSSIPESTDATDTSGTTESQGTETTETDSTDTTETTYTESTDTTETSETETTESTVSGDTESSVSSESTVSGSSDTTESTDTDGTDTTEHEKTGSTDTSETQSTGTTESTDSSSDSSGSTESSVSGSEGTASSIGETTTKEKEFFPGEDEAGGAIKEQPTEQSTETFTSSTESAGTTESSSSGSTEEGASTTEFTGSTEEGASTTESASSSVGESESTSERSSEPSGSTESSETTGSTESSETSGSTVEFTGSTESTTEFTGSTESTTEFTGSTESTSEFTGSTESEGSTTEFTGTTESGVTESDIFTVTGESTTEGAGTSSIMDIFSKKPRMCKRRKIKACKKTKFGCCWDNITPAQGPFDKGCPNPHTCKESKFGCCQDGVSAALGPKNAGCPPSQCEETLFGCCSDNKTPAEGNDNEGCPPPCISSKFGCCDDNTTEATGPNHKGCPEESTTAPTTTEGTTESGITGISNTEVTPTEPPSEDCNTSPYRCCPDGVTSATGPGYQGCNLPCSNSSFGCCSDANTPAHGPSGEGCCLSTPFGCCQDNIVPARGPNMDGCGCQQSLYGCCPDNKTSARGYDNEGCGCQYTQHGCCPDNFTPANGPEYQGCKCHTYQFGCCPDGVTTAQGPHQQGCGCRHSEFGCCSDEETPAAGPNQQGCSCESSKFGCCLDGVTESQGENFDGCDTAPANLQAGCSSPKEKGTCRNYTVKWFFDMDYGGCSRFWYGGCAGNGNRYKSKEECEQICVEPQGTDICKLPKVTGPCEGYYPLWYYDKDQNYCTQFIYGGCLGNNNRFETREECMGLCVRDNNIDACEQNKEEGPCQGQYQRFYYNKESAQCEPFVYGGCKGNTNNFQSLEACQQKCTAPDRKKDHCSLPRAQGNCTERLPKWYFDTPEKRCVPFYYSGCHGNQNNFDSKEACENDCPPEVVKDTCFLPAETGECANYVDRWYYDTRGKSCRQFYYGGCGGNGNNFETENQCQQRCVQKEEPQPEYPQPQQPDYEQPQPQPEQPVPSTQPEPFSADMCFLPSETGPCRASFVKFFYDRADGVCKSFTYGGCGGNRNNFETQEECLQHCGAAQDLCVLPPVVGPCDGEYLQYYYDQTSDTCIPFNYGGCEGNYNRFQDQASCEQRCRRAPPAVPVTQGPPVSSDITMCYQPNDPGNCTDEHPAYFYNINERKCESFTYTGCGGNDNRFNSEEQCERQCGIFRGQDICNLDKDAGTCRGYFIKYYYNKNTGGCEPFVYGGCAGNGNRFSSNQECEHICVIHEETKPNISTIAICKLPVDQGSCEGGYHRRWYFDDTRGECLAFIYTGCGGNFNNFKSYQSCLDFCRELLPRTEAPAPEPTVNLPPHPCQEVFDECTNLRCPYGVEPYIDENDCNRCRCRDPCFDVQCPEDEQCGIDLNINKTSSTDADFIAICRKRNKPGQCPSVEQNDNYCEQECRTDADCTQHLKCCSTGCGTSCMDPTPGQLVTQQPEQPAYTAGPPIDAYAPPKVDLQVYEPDVHALIGDQAILRCAVSGNPNPRIKWSKDNIMIDGTQPRYRIKLDQSLQIITLHKTDSGIYLCTADNGIGDPITNQIKLDVLDSEPRPASILDLGQEEPPVVVSLNAPTTLNCFVLGHPVPAITWWKDDSIIPFKNSEFEVRKDYSLLIHSVKLHNLGIYTCQAYNGYGKAASWAVTVKARGPYRFTDPNEFKYRQFIVNPPEEPTTPAPATAPPPPPPPPPPEKRYPPLRPTPQPYTIPPYTEPSNEIIPEPIDAGPAPSSIIVPVRANITSNDDRYPVDSDIDIPCAVVGYPAPQVQWYKDGIPLYPSDRIRITDSNTLTILQASKADSGYYQCEATNAYSKASSTLQISIEGMYIHPSCTDNQFFANCALIVKAKICNHRYYAKFCCRSCTEAGLLPVDGSQFHSKQDALERNLV